MRIPLYSIQVPKAKCNFHSDSQPLARKSQGIFSTSAEALTLYPACQSISAYCFSLDRKKKRWEVTYSFTQIASLLPETGLYSGAGQSQLRLCYKATVLFIMAVWCGLFTDLEYKACVSQGPHLGNQNTDWYYYSFLAKSIRPPARATAYSLFWSESLQHFLWV